MKRSTKILALLLAMAMCIGMLAGCGDNNANTDPNAGQNTEQNNEQNNQQPEQPANDTPLVVGYAPFSSKFSPFFAATAYDQDVQAMTQVGLLTSDRTGAIILKGIEGETKNYNGTDYTYYGIADLEITENSDGTVYYDIEIRDDVKFSDGEKLTIDDVIFSMYVLCDPTYDGASTLYAQPIQGIDEYRAGAFPIGNQKPLLTESFGLLVQGNFGRIALKNSRGEEVVIEVTVDSITVDRSKSGDLSYFDDVDPKLFKKEDLLVSTTKRYMRGNVNMEIIFDVSYLEIYADGGLETASVCVYPDAPYQVVSTDGDLEVKMYTIKK